MCRKWFFSFVFFITVVSANGQFRKIPAVVTDAFKAKYGNASAVSWKDKFSSFQADFKVGNTEMKSTFTSKGEWLKTEKKHAFVSIPTDVKDSFKKSKYADLTVSEIIEVEEKDKQTQFKMTVKKGDLNKKRLVFAKTGQLVSDNSLL
jgi:hypothetical protein